jgi:hypothetical protein
MPFSDFDLHGNKSRLGPANDRGIDIYLTMGSKGE